MNACILLPKMQPLGPDVPYIWYRTPWALFIGIDWGTYHLDQTVLCAAGSTRIVSTEDGLRPSIEWEQISRMDTVLDAVEGLEIRLSAVGIFAGFAAIPRAFAVPTQSYPVNGQRIPGHPGGPSGAPSGRCAAGNGPCETYAQTN